MVAAAQESKRLGLCNKAMFVVPNHLVGQWASGYLRLYPSANILVTRKQDFETGNRKKFCSGQKVLRPDSYIPRVFDRVGARFMEKSKEIGKGI